MDANTGIGVVYTPLEWAEWAIVESGAYAAWILGAEVLDPTMGNGAFIESFVAHAIKNGEEVTSERLGRLHGYEIQEDGIEFLIARMERDYSVELPRQNFKCADFILGDIPGRFDYVVGNPPWVNFQGLPTAYREELKSKYLEFGLVANSGSVLLGNSRVDIAALIVNVAVGKCLKDEGRVAMFLPSSLFFGGSSHDQFRKFHSLGRNFSLERLYDFGAKSIFASGQQHGTSYCFADFFSGPGSRAAIEFKVLGKDGQWRSEEIRVVNDASGSFVRNTGALVKVKVSNDSKPRQGVNTGGANRILFGEIVEGSLRDDFVVFKNGLGDAVSIESRFLFPLICREQFKSGNEVLPSKFVLMCHDSVTGKAVSEDVLGMAPSTKDYLYSYRESLVARKGVLMNAHISKGKYWALLGVGRYNFAHYKLVWLTAGQKSFLPKVFSDVDGKPWQGNQSLQAFMPFPSEVEALQISDRLKLSLSGIDPQFLGRPGTLGWAQPGRISHLLEIA